MKISNSKQALCAMVLTSMLFAPTLVTASATTSTDTSTSTTDSGTGTTSSTGTGTGTTSSGVATNEGISFIMGVPSGQQDISRKDLAAALINYEAAARVQEYQYNQQLLFMGAPGMMWALTAAAVVGSSDTSSTALAVANTGLVNSLGGYVNGNKTSPANTLTINGVEYPINTDQFGPLQFYNKMKDFIASGDTTNLGMINPAIILQADNLSSSTPVVPIDQAESVINMMTNPFPYVDPDLQNKIQSGKELTGADMETIGDALASYAVTGMSVSALGDIVARRYPVTGQTQSVMQIMDSHSKQRFTSADWYNSISVASDSALLREIAHMMAFNSWVAYQQFRVSEEQLALMASMNAVMAKMNAAMSQMNKQMISSQAQAKASSKKLDQINKQNQNSSSSSSSSGSGG